MERNDEWLSDTAGYGRIFVPAGTEFEFCEEGLFLTALESVFSS